MRWIFSLAGLIAVVAVVGLLAKKQLQTLQPAAGGAATASAAAASPQTAPRQAADDVAKALEAGQQRNARGEGQ